MSGILNEIRHLNRDAAKVLEQADLHTDADIRSLTREELHELFPGPKNLKLRRVIFEKVQKQKPIGVLLKELKAFIPHESIRDALTSNGVLVDYLRILKDLKTEMNHVQSFLDAHIGFLEDLSQKQQDQESDKGSLSGTSIPGTAEPLCTQPQGTDALGAIGQIMPCTGPTDGHAQGAPSTPGFEGMVDPTPTGGRQKSPQTTVMYQKVISGKTFGADAQLMNKVTSQVQDVLFVESSEDGQIIIVFCPISSRIASDVETAMTCVKDDKPVILVLMHHAREVRCTTPARTWQNHDEVVLHVNVFYHETEHGLLSCNENDRAASEIRNKLMEYKILRSRDGTPDCDNRGSDANSRGSFFNFPKFGLRGK